MKRDRSIRLIGATAVAVFAWAGLLHAVSAHMGTPAASPVTSDAVECPTDERLTVERLRELGGRPAPGVPDHGAIYFDGATPPPGVPADEETVAAVTKTIRQYFACLDNLDWAGAYALYADDTLRFLTTDPVRDRWKIDPTSADYPFLAVPTRPLPESLRSGHIDVSNVTVRPDGRVGAVNIVETYPEQVKRGINYIVLAWEHGRWRLVSPLSHVPVTSRFAVPAKPVP